MQPHRTSSSVADTRYKWCSIALGVIVGVVWFCVVIGVPPAFRGVFCCDAAEYLSLGSEGIAEALRHISNRTFGYPLFVALVRGVQWFTPPLPLTLLVAQLLLSFASSGFLGWALSRSGLPFRPWMYAVLLANPVVVGIASVSLSDSLATSLFTALVALTTLLAFGSRRAGLIALISGGLMGYLVAIRPIYALIVPVFLLAILISAVRYGRVRSNVRPALFVFALAVVGLLPSFIILVKNCQSAFGRSCLVNPRSDERSTVSSFNIAMRFSRYDCLVDSQSGELIGWAPTTDKVFKQSCETTQGNVTGSLIGCYLMNRESLLTYFQHRLIGLFDVRHFNPYAAPATPIWANWTLRVFGLMGLLGVPAIVCLLLVQLFRFRSWEYLLLPIAYVVVQMHFHVENRYIFPLLPLSSCLVLMALFNPGYFRRWQAVAIWVFALVVTAISYRLIVEWDAMHFARYQFL